MLVITATEFAKSPIKYYEAAAKGSVFVKYAENYIKLVLAKRLPRVRKLKNPNNPSPSGDTWFDDPRNMAEVMKGIESLKYERTYTNDDPEIKAIFEWAKS